MDEQRRPLRSLGAAMRAPRFVRRRACTTAFPLELRNPDAGAALAEAAREIYERERECGDANEEET